MSNFPISAVDIFPTILDLAEIQIESDGRSFKKALFKEDSANNYLLIEYWGEGNANTVDTKCPWGPKDQLSVNLFISKNIFFTVNVLQECSPESWCKCQDSKNNTYSCILEIHTKQKLKFCLFENNFIEAYDLITDPHEINNLKLDNEQIHHYLTILEKLKRCKGSNCQIKI